MPITIDESVVPDGSALSDFTFLLDVTSTNLTAASGKVTNASGFDILITDESGSALDFELISYTSGTGQYQAWVEIPTFEDAVNTTLYIYYGNSSVSADQSSSGTWSNGYVIVDHMEASGAANAVGNGISPSSDNTSSATGQIGGARSFDGAGDIVVYPDNNALDLTNDFTITAWVNSTNGASQPDLITKGGYQSAYSTWINSDDLVLHTDADDLQSATNSFAGSTWEYCAFVWNSASGRFIYLDGTQIATDGTTTNATTTTSTLTFSTLDYDYAGLLDEVRIIDAVRSAEWIQTEYNNQNNPTNFASLGTEECGGLTYYTYQSGNFTTANVWTTDPSGTTLQNAAVPDECDNVVILSGRTVTSTANNIEVVSLTINGGATFDIGTSTGHDLGNVSGTGTLISRTTSFPSGDFTSFGSASGGTLQLIDAGTGNFPIGSGTWNEVDLISTNATVDIISLASDVTILGDLDISQTSGSVEFRFGNNTTDRTLVVEGDVNVGSGTSMTVGSFDAFHEFELQGSLTADGDIDFSNSAQYSTASSGAVNLTFTGLSDEVLTGSGSQLDLYRLIVYKGTDITYEVAVDHSALAMYGPTNQANGSTSSPFSVENPEINKAIWVRAGTLRLQSGVSIPALTEGGNDYFIPLAGQLWIDGADVASTSLTGSSGNTGLTVIGTFKISGGTWSGNKSAGIVYRGTSTVIIEGGVVNISQYRPSGTVIGSANTSSYTQSGGVFICRGENGQAGEVGVGNGIFDLNFSTSGYNQSGGTIEIRDVASSGTGGGVLIGVDAANASATGGRIVVNLPGGTSGYVSSTVPLTSLYTERESGTGDATVFVDGNTIITDSLVVGTNSVFDGQANDITIRGNVEVIGTLTPGTGTWKADDTGSRTWTLGGTINDFQNLDVELTGSDSLVISGPSDITVSNELSVTSGILNNGTTRIDVNGSFNNSGIVRGSEAVRFNSGTSFTWGGSGSGIVKQIEIGGTTSSSSTVTLSSNQIVSESLTFITGDINTSRTVDLASFNLSLPNSSAIVGAGTNGTGYSGFSTGELASNGGLSIDVNATSTTFPMVANAAYAPATLTLSSAPSSYGTVTVIPVDAEHPNVTQTSQSLTYYFKVTSGIALGSSTGTWEFTYNQSDVVGTEGDYATGKFTGLSWLKDGTGSINTSNNTIDFGGSTYNSDIAGDYTAGNTNSADPFGAVDIYYSRQNGAWSATSSWSLTGHNVDNQPSQQPQSNSIVVIGDNDSIWTTANNEESGSLTIEEGSSLDIQANTGHDFGIVTGTGSLRIRQVNLPSGDLSGFLGASGGTVVIYVSGSDQTFTGHNISCRRMKWVLQTGHRVTLRDATFDVLEDLTCISLGNNTEDYRIEQVQLDVGGNINVISGDFRFRNSRGVTNMTVGEDFYVGSNARIQINQNTDRVHTLEIGDSLVIDGGFDTYLNASRYVDMTFNGTGVSAITGSGTTQILNIQVDKGSDTTSQLWFSHTGTFNIEASSWLALSNGLFVYDRNDTRTVSSATSTFTIPATAGIRMAASGGTLNIIDADDDAADLILSGYIGCSDGTLNIGSNADDAGNDISFTTSGNPVLDVNGGTFNVNGQVRRDLATSLGAVQVSVTDGGTLTIRGKNASDTRGKLEILNSGSLTMDASSEIVFERGGAGSTIADLYIESGLTTLSGGTITFNTASGVSTAEETFTINSADALYNLQATGSAGDIATLQLKSRGLTLSGDLTTSNANSAFDANEFDVSMAGNLTLNGSGDWTGSTLTVTSSTDFTGDATTTNAFENVVISGSASLNFLSGSDATASGTLNINSLGSIDLGTSFFQVEGNATVNGDVTSDAASASNGLVLAGSSAQNLFGSGTIDNLIINNAAGVNTLSDISVNRQLELTSGVLFLAANALTLSEDVAMTGSFSASNMIATNGVLTDEGVYYSISAGAKSFLLPIGSNGKYTPASYDFTSLSASGQLQVVPVDILHPSTTDTAETQLDYYWFVQTSGLGSYTVSHQYQYDNLDVNGIESSWVAGYFDLVNWTPSGGIANAIDPTNDSITIWSVDYLDGEFTAGEADEFGEAPIFYSRTGSGVYDWDDPNSWSNDSHLGVAAATAPTGAAKIVIASGDSITTNGDLRICQSVQNNGVLNVGTTIGHNFGRFNGSGKLILDVAPSNVYISPAGIFVGFASDTGGTWVYTGSVNADILNGLNSYKNLQFEGTSTKDLGSQNLTIYGDLNIYGGNVTNTSNIDLEIRGNWTNTSGAAAYTSGSETITFTGTATSEVSGSTSFNNVVVNKTSGADSLEITNGTTTISGSFSQTSGALSLNGGNIDLGGNITNGTWYGTDVSSVTISGTGSISSPVTFGMGGQSLNNFTITRAQAISLNSDLDVAGTLTLGTEDLSLTSSTLTINNAIAGTPTSLQTTNATTLEVHGTGSGIQIPTSVSALKILELDNPNGLSLSSALNVNDSIRALNGALNAAGNDLSIGANGWVVRGDGSYTESVNYAGNGNILWINSTSITSGGEVPTSRNTVQTASVNGSASVALGSDLVVNSSLVLNQNLSLGSDSLSLYGTITGSGELASSGSGSLALHGSGAISLPAFTTGQQSLASLVVQRTGTHTLQSNLEVIADLDLLRGHIEVDANNLSLGSAIAISNASNASFLSTGSTGSVVIQTPSTGAYTAPLGDLTTDLEYSPIEIRLTGGNLVSTSTLATQCVDAIATECPGATDYLTRYWNVVSTDVTDAEGSVRMWYTDDDIVGTEANILGKRFDGTNCVNGDSAILDSNIVSVFIDGFGEFSGREIDIATEPTTAATSFSVTNVSTLNFDVDWTNGDGQERLVIAREGAPVSFEPEDNVFYTFNTEFGASTPLNGTEYAVYKGSGADFTVTGLSPNRTYYFEIFEFNKLDTLSENYLVSSSLTGDQNTAIEMDLTVFLEGPLDSVSGEMSTTLQSSALIPTSQPFGSFYAGSESVGSVPADVTDWVYVQIFDAESPSDAIAINSVHEGAYFLKKTGGVVGLDGTSSPEILPTESGHLRVLIRTRNHLNLISADTLSPSSNIHTLDTRINGGVSTSPTNVIAGWHTIPAGVIENTTPNSIDMADAVEVWMQRNALNVYQIGDVTMDGEVNADDRSKVFENIGKDFSVPE
ncbi:beta strand repeat-containing protein [Phaeocystidibacter luteus]|nr:DUF2341 domain-containing protein [Phaeocystidibacter luteus]